MPKIHKNWIAQDIKFSALYTGYLGSAKQIKIVKDIALDCIEEGGPLIVDPAMADGGRLYTGFDAAYVREMKKLCGCADIILPNITEACLMTENEYKTEFDTAYIEKLINDLTNICNGSIILTGVSFSANKNGVAVYQNGELQYYEHDKVGSGCHGTGDVYASAFTGALMRGKNLFDAARIAADFTVSCIKNTANNPEHWYGVSFETCLGELINMLK
jgi:pyridoxine kinase